MGKYPNRWKSEQGLLKVPVRVWSRLGYALSAKRDKDGAIAEYRKALALKPDNAETQNSLGHALRKKK
jgi:Flp pilus assembly protein TadD